MKKKKIIIVGAGPGGLTSAMILAHRGHDVEVFEKDEQVGGRNQELAFDGFSFDTGPTFLMFKSILDETFSDAGRNAEDYLEFAKLDPMYRLVFEDVEFDVTDDHERMREIIAEKFPGDEKGFDKFLKREDKRLKRLYPCLKKDYTKFRTYFHPDFIKAIPFILPPSNMYKELGKYFKHEELKIAFTFQSKYLGMSPWTCPAAFMIIPYIEHAHGIYHVQGGLCKISEAMQKVTEEEGGKINLNTEVKKIIVKDGKAIGVKLNSGEEIMADEIILNADFGYAMKNLFEEGIIKRWSEKRMMKKNWSCSTYMMYIGLDNIFDMPHHSIYFSQDYKKYIDNVNNNRDSLEDVSFYIRNASPVDSSLAPSGMSGIYVLVPVSNLKGETNWAEMEDRYRDHVIRLIEERTPLKNIEGHIVSERVIVPNDWQDDYNVFLGATFNLGHNIPQMFHSRPRNKFEEVDNCYLVGGGTHPGSGLPTIYESGRISANLIEKN